MKAYTVWYTLLSIPIVGVMAFTIFQPIIVLPRIALAPGYSLLDQHGNRLTSEDQRGRLTLYNVAYSQCTTPCAPMNATMYQIQQTIITQKLKKLPVDLITVSIDSETDTQETLQRYARTVGASEEHWRFATGDPVQLKEMIGGNFNTYYSQRDDGKFELDPAFILVDGWGIQRAEYRVKQPDLEIIQRDINLLLEEAENSEGITKYAYEAAHLFLCYP